MTEKLRLKESLTYVGSKATENKDYGAYNYIGLQLISKNVHKTQKSLILGMSDIPIKR